MFAVLAAATLFSCPHRVDRKPPPQLSNPAFFAAGRQGEPLFAGFAKEVITPEGPVLMGGFGIMRLSRGVHDDLFVRTLVLRQGSVRLALVSVDVVGLQLGDVNRIKQQVAGFSPDEMVIASTHNHAGPDTLGLWGLPPFISGRSRKYIDRIGDAVGRTIAAADREAVPVSVAAAVYELTPGIMVNLNRGEPVDDAMGLLVFRDHSSRPVAVLLNINGHPEAMWSDNHILSADYPGRLCELTEEKFGGGAVFFSAALGAMMSPARPGPGEARDFARLERISQRIFQDIERGMERLVEEEDPLLVHKVGRFLVPVENRRFKLLAETGIIEREVYEGDRILTQVHLIELGSIQMVTFPGEVYPKMGLNIRARQKPLAFQIGLADDELGYIIYPDDFGTELYKYESSMSTGPRTSLLVERALFELMGAE